jgi:carbon monoxide dehydrogenase subunit G
MEGKVRGKLTVLLTALLLIFSIAVVPMIGGVIAAQKAGRDSVQLLSSGEDAYPGREPQAFPEDTGSFDFEGNYEAPELTIDGIADEPEWSGEKALQLVSWTMHGSGTALTDQGGGTTVVKGYRGAKALFFHIDVKDKRLLSYGNSNGDDVNAGDSIEFYLNDLKSETSANGYQINLGVHNKTRIMRQSNSITTLNSAGALSWTGWGAGWGAWNALIDYQFALDGTLNDNENNEDVGYSCEVMIPYSQLGIDSDTEVAVSFGRVNRWKLTGNSIGNSAASNTHDWNGPWGDPNAATGAAGGMSSSWHLWTTPTDTNPAGTIDTTMANRVKPPADVTGIVTDSGTKAPISGVLIKSGGTIESDGTVSGGTLVATTGADGKFAIEQVNPVGFTTTTYTVEDPNHYATSFTLTAGELRYANGGVVFKNIEMIDSTAPKTTITGSLRNVLTGLASGATIEAIGTPFTATSQADGTFSLPNVPITGGATVRISKANYATEEIFIPASELEAGVPEALGEISFNYGWNNNVSTVRTMGDTGLFTNVQTTRTLTGLRFRMTSTGFTGSAAAILYLHAGTVGTHSESAVWTDKAVALVFRANGTIGFEKSGGKYHQNNTSSIGYRIIDEDTQKTLIMDIPYAYMNNMNPWDSFGFAGGVFNTAGGWNGGANWGAWIAPESPWEYRTIDFRNHINSATTTIAANTARTATATVQINVFDANGTTRLNGVAVSSAGGLTTIAGTTNGSGNSAGRVSVTGQNLTSLFGGTGTTVTYAKAGYETLTDEFTAAGLFHGIDLSWNTGTTNAANTATLTVRKTMITAA